MEGGNLCQPSKRLVGVGRGGRLYLTPKETNLFIGKGEGGILYSQGIKEDPTLNSQINCGRKSQWTDNVLS